jgi:outer membrane protein assembly factor BamD (BamD/ComL family)
MTHNLVDPATITTEMAVQIRTWRVDEDFSWRAVAQAASELWGSAYGSNQLYGEDLCAAAAQVLGENPFQEPWN